LHDLDSRFFQDTIGRAVAARNTGVRVDLPHHVNFLVLMSRKTGNQPEGGQTAATQAVLEEIPPVHWLVSL